MLAQLDRQPARGNKKKREFYEMNIKVKDPADATHMKEIHEMALSCINGTISPLLP